MGNEDLKTNEDGLELIKEFEGLELDAYRCPAGVETIGYGTTVYPNGDKVRMGDSCTEDEAEMYLKSDLVKFEDAVKRLIDVDLNENQFSALVSFTYNLGEGNLRKSTLRRRLNIGDYNVGNEFGKWVKANGRTLSGLVRRRKAERQLFESEIAIR
jgi:lysozyme